MGLDGQETQFETYAGEKQIKLQLKTYWLFTESCGIQARQQVKRDNEQG